MARAISQGLSLTQSLGRYLGRGLSHPLSSGLTPRPLALSLPCSAEAIIPVENCQGDNEGIQGLLFIYFSIKKLHE